MAQGSQVHACRRLLEWSTWKESAARPTHLRAADANMRPKFHVCFPIVLRFATPTAATALDEPTTLSLPLCRITADGYWQK